MGTAAVRAWASGARRRLSRISAGAGAGGLASPGVRWALVFAWAMGSVRRVLDERLTIPFPWLPIAYALLLLAVLLLTRRENLPLRGAGSGLVPALAIASLVIVLAARPDEQPVWLLHFTAYLMAFLFVRGNPLLGGLGVVCHLAVVFAWVAVSGASPALFPQILVASLVACTVAVVWRATLGVIVERERAHRSAAAELERQVAAEQAAAARLRGELDLVRSKTEGILTRLRDGEPLDEAFRTDIAVVEGEIRDRIRSPRLQHPELNREIAAARSRGASVNVLADDSPGAPQLDAATAGRIAAVLRGVEEPESLVVAWNEPGRVTVVARSGGRSERHVVEVAGIVEARSA